MNGPTKQALMKSCASEEAEGQVVCMALSAVSGNGKPQTLLNSRCVAPTRLATQNCLKRAETRKVSAGNDPASQQGRG